MYAQLLKDIHRQQVTHDCLQTQREQARVKLQQAHFPTQKDEAWKYTNLEPLLTQTFNGVTAPAELDLTCLSVYYLNDSYRLLFVDGAFVAQGSLLPPAGIFVQPLSACLAQEFSWLNTLWQESNAPLFANMNAAYAKEGVVIRLDAGVALDKPLQILFVASPRPDNWIANTRIVLDLGAQAQLTLLEQHIGLGDNCYFNNITSRMNLGSASSLRWTRLQSESQAAYHLAQTHCQLAPKAQLLAHSLSCGGRLARHEVSCDMQEASRAQLSGVFWTQSGQHLEERVLMNHQMPSATCKLDYRGIIDGTSRGVFNGKIKVEQAAQKTLAELNNKNLLLSATAEIDTKPELEIDADDVRVSHGATVGQLDAEALFSLRSRGIGKDRARKLLIRAFAQALPLSKVLPAIKILWEDELQKKIADKGRVA